MSSLVTPELRALAFRITRTVLEELPVDEKPTEAVRVLLFALVRVCYALDDVSSQRDPFNIAISKEFLMELVAEAWDERPTKRKAASRAN